MNRITFMKVQPVGGRVEGCLIGHAASCPNAGTHELVIGERGLNESATVLANNSEIHRGCLRCVKSMALASLKVLE